ncbi:hypothetical protein CVT24_012852 [Panaeolus cyanescens]|uniref:Tyr recombinase domain-containing protein n=1 Tax=Panaeolus cyanescens TaxID=181874 RepID=A0A409WWR3_9AGAR|nr:hypothetical protein CVT24_012852 [Panaeolus cyanescens]
MEGKFMNEVVFGIKERICLMGDQRSLMTIDDMEGVLRNWSGGEDGTGSHEAQYCYSDEEIDQLSVRLGIKWEPEKTITFREEVPFLGFCWDLQHYTVALLQEKKEKYQREIQEWKSRKRHTLEQVQKLYGKLLHTSQIIPEGRAYLTNLETMLAIGHNRPFVPHTPPKHTAGDIVWWETILSGPTIKRDVRIPQELNNLEAYSDASSGYGIGVTIGNKPNNNSATTIRNHGNVTRYMAITEELSRGGGQEGAATGKSTASSEGSTRFVAKIGSQSIRDTYQVPKTQLMVHHEESIHQNSVDFQRSIYPTNSQSSYQKTSAKEMERANPGLTKIQPDLAKLYATSWNNRRLQHSGQSEDKKRVVAGAGEVQGVVELVGGAAAREARGQAERRGGKEISNLPVHQRKTNSRVMPYPNALKPNTSNLRPHCLAGERLQKWKPLQSRENSGIGITDEDMKRIAEVLQFSWEESTKVTYGSGLLVFHVFCDKRGISEERRAPVHADVLSAFIASLAGAYSGKTIRNYVWGIRAWHILHGAEWRLNHTEVEGLLTASDKLTPPSSKSAKREPYTPEYIKQIREGLNLEDPFDAAVYACLTTCFYATARLGEFTVQRVSDSFDPQKNISIRHLSKTIDRKGNEVTNLHIPRTKVSDSGEDVYWAAQNDETDPVQALENHRRINEPPDDAHLFSYKTTKGRKPLTKTAFIRRVSAASKAKGLAPIPGHGIRIGSTLEYLLRGVPFEVMKTKGRWSGGSFQIYLRKHAQVIASYIQAVPDVHAEFVRYSTTDNEASGPGSS